MTDQTYLVRVGGCPAGTVTTRGTVTNVERPDMDHYRLTFSTGEVAQLRYNQSLSVLTDEAAAAAHDCWDHAVEYVSDGPLGHGWECGLCGAFLQAG